MRLAVVISALSLIGCGGEAFTGGPSAIAGEGGAPDSVTHGGSRTARGGAPAGDAGEAGNGAAGEPVSTGGASAGASNDAGEAGTGAASEETGSAGAGGDGGHDTLDECSTPVGNTVVCDGLCNREPSSICNSCNGLAPSGTGGYVVLGSKSNATNQPRSCGCNDSTTIRLSVKAMTCSKFTVQPGALAGFAVDSCEPVSLCLVVTGLVEGAGTERGVYVTRPDQNAWVHQENAELTLGKCPLSCD